MTQPDPTIDFDGCNRRCRRAGAHTLVYGECEHAPEPEPTVSLLRVYKAADGFPAIGFDTYTVPELGELITAALRASDLPTSGGDLVDIGLVAAHAIVHRTDEPAVLPADQAAYARGIRDAIETGTRPCGHDDYHDGHPWHATPGVWCPGISDADGEQPPAGQAPPATTSARAAILREAAELAGETPAACPGYETAPNRCACPCEGCTHNCGAHQEGETPATTPETAVALTDGPVRCPLCPTPVTLHTPNGARAHFTHVHPEQRITGRGLGPWPLIVTDADEAQQQDELLAQPQSCRSDTGIAVGLVDALITILRVLAPRDLSPGPVQEALTDLTQDPDLDTVLRALSRRQDAETQQQDEAPPAAEAESADVWVGATEIVPDREVQRLAATGLVGYRQDGGRLLHCLGHKPAPAVGHVDFHEVTAGDLPDGGFCVHPSCGADLLAVQPAAGARQDGAQTS
ncbi:hypothetical protein SZN_09426 [Streptomyces zinciresistens K42]|uniref:Uncharacterized protein n=1 Tax=Streptomyces zinciresistens K42 TaxID=700597 RepID=G2G8R7_9ACTN|nr:hypothetical protein [Streptomyces zinciresistens]EGX60132.1 hypothetical protein SZN_09426 [Streptomyces zinciresistens K42]